MAFHHHVQIAEIAQAFNNKNSINLDEYIKSLVVSFISALKKLTPA